MDPSSENQEQINTLEDPSTIDENASVDTTTPSNEPASALNSDDSDALSSTLQSEVPAQDPNHKPKESLPKKLKRLVSKVNIYLLIFILIFIVAIVIVIVSIQQSKKETKSTNTTQKLSQEELDQLEGTDAKVGDPKQILTVESNAIFAGKVLVRDGLEVAGQLKVGGALSLTGLNVAGTSTFDIINANSLSIANNASIQGTLTVQKGLNVSGGASFSGPISAPSITIDSLQLNGDLQINRHLNSTGVTPGKSDGGALGGGGTSSVSGSDTAGSITLNTGSGPGGGTLINITFANRFDSVPHVVITPVGSGAAGLNYFVTRTSTGFSVGTTNAPPAFSSFGFDYIVIN